MWLRLSLLLLLTLALVVVRLPASLMDTLLARASGGTLRLVEAHGSVWQGRGVLAISAGQRTLQAVRAVEWSLDGQGSPLGLGLRISEHGHPQGRVWITPDGVDLAHLEVDLPLPLIAAAIPHPAARAGWRGRLLLGSSGFGCDWRTSCEGALTVQWRDAGLDILPERELGAHEIRFQSVGRAFDITVHTLEGDLRVNGGGRLEADGRFNFQATVEGDPEVVDRMPNVMGRNARLTGTPGRVVVSLP